MQRIFFIIVTALTFLMLFNVLPVKGQNEQKQEEWTGKRKDGTPITRRDLDKIISEHL